jgi:hypothetical protein
MILEINQKLPKKLTGLLGTCDKYLCYQRRYLDLERKFPCRDSDPWVAIPVFFTTDQLMSTHEFPWLVPSLKDDDDDDEVGVGVGVGMTVRETLTVLVNNSHSRSS